MAAQLSGVEVSLYSNEKMIASLKLLFALYQGHRLPSAASRAGLSNYLTEIGYLIHHLRSCFALRKLRFFLFSSSKIVFASGRLPGLFLWFPSECVDTDYFLDWQVLSFFYHLIPNEKKCIGKYLVLKPGLLGLPATRDSKHYLTASQPTHIASFLSPFFSQLSPLARVWNCNPRLSETSAQSWIGF